MLITCACSVSAALKNIPAQAELPPNVMSVSHLELLPSEVPRHLEIHGRKL